MIIDETWIGKRVRVRADHRRPEFRDREGYVAQRYGSPEYAALEVSFEDGDSQLFWFHELDELEDEPVERRWLGRAFRA